MSKVHRFKIEKLIRDQLPDLLLQDNVFVKTKIMDQNEYLKALNNKLLEEANEVISAKTTAEYREELADLLEVIHAFSAAYAIPYEQIEQQRLQKRASKGGFEGRIYSSYVKIQSDNKHIVYYQAKPNEYPEINDIN